MNLQQMPHNARRGSESGILASQRWIVHTQPRSDVRLRLFCLPCAGGSAQLFMHWSGALPATVGVFPVELPGRSGRFRETPFRRLPDLVDALLEVLLIYLDRPFAFLGHSMGALVAFELTRRLRQEGHMLPVQLFVSAYRAPHLDNPDANTYKLSDQALMDRMRLLGGTPPEVLAEPELLELVLTTLRADFEMLGTYCYMPEPPLDCPITVFGGMSDRLVSSEQLEAWRKHTSREFMLQLFPGGHFYLQTAQPLFWGVLNAALEAINY